MKDTETAQKEILKMIKNLSSKIEFLSNKTPSVTNDETTETDLANQGSSAQQAEMYELPHRDGQQMVTGVTVSQEIPRSSSLPPTQPDVSRRHIEQTIGIAQKRYSTKSGIAQTANGIFNDNANVWRR